MKSTPWSWIRPCDPRPCTISIESLVQGNNVVSVAPTDTVAAGLLPQVVRNVLFISKATPGDDEFALWLAPRLEAEGYTVFADILSLDAGTR